MPTFAHVSLILAPDKSKLSKRHGATSVGQVHVSCKKVLSDFSGSFEFFFPILMIFFFILM